MTNYFKYQKKIYCGDTGEVCEGYNRYLQSKHWLLLRNTLIHKNTVCDMCGERPDSGLQLHHITYDHIGHELATDLVPLCENCHKLIHTADVNQNNNYLGQGANLRKHKKSNRHKKSNNSHRKGRRRHWVDPEEARKYDYLPDTKVKQSNRTQGVAVPLVSKQPTERIGKYRVISLDRDYNMSSKPHRNREAQICLNCVHFGYAKACGVDGKVHSGEFCNLNPKQLVEVTDTQPKCEHYVSRRKK